MVSHSEGQVAALPLGAFLDRYGPRVSSMMGGVVFAVGCAVFSMGIVKSGKWPLSDTCCTCEDYADSRI